MAVSVGLTIKELNNMADALGISDKVVGSGKNGKVKKEDLISPIRDYNLIARYGSLDNVPEHLKMMLSIKSPMLAGRIDSFKAEQQEEVWESDDWDLEQKLNGVRCFLINDGTGLHMYSRHNSDVDLLPICFTDRILLPNNFDVSAVIHTFMLDCEITSDNSNICTILEGSGVETVTQLQAVTSILGSLPDRALQIQRENNLYLVFNGFDCIFYDGKWIMSEPLYVRREIAESIISSLSSLGFNVRKVVHSNKNKKQFFKSFIDAGLEGVVAKRLSGKYIADTTRNFNGWVKIKRGLKSIISKEFDVGSSFSLDDADFGSFDDILGGVSFGDTLDVFVTGFEPGTKGSAFEGLVGSVAVSAFVRKSDGSLEQRELGKFSGISMNERTNMTEIINGEPNLKPEYYGRCVEVDAQQITKNGRFQHCVFQRWRFDKNKDSCIIDEDFLLRNIV